MIYSSSDIECDRLKLWVTFCPFTKLKTKKIRISKKWKRLLEISSFYTGAPKTTIIWYKVPEIRSERQNFCHFGPFNPPHPPPELVNDTLKSDKENATYMYTETAGVQHSVQMYTFHFFCFFFVWNNGWMLFNKINISKISRTWGSEDVFSKSLKS